MNAETKHSGVVVDAMRSGAKRLRLGVESPLTADLLDKYSAAVAELIESLEWALLRIRTSLDTGDRYAEAEAALKRARGDA